MLLAANIWHWWIGVALTLVGVLAVAGLGVTYMKSITARRFPPESRARRAREQDL